jgi:hypothetical protein
MQFYRTDAVGDIIGFHGSEIGLIIEVLNNQLWSKIQFNGQLRSQKWWNRRLESLINSTVIIENNLLPGIYNQDGTPAPIPIPLEVEFNMPNLNWEMLMQLKPYHTKGLQIGEKA